MTKPTTLYLLRKLFPQDKVVKIVGEPIYRRVSQEGPLEVIVYYLVLPRNFNKEANVETLRYSNYELEEKVAMEKLANGEIMRVAFRVGNRFIFQYI